MTSNYFSLLRKSIALLRSHSPPRVSILLFAYPITIPDDKNFDFSDFAIPCPSIFNWGNLDPRHVIIDIIRLAF